MFKIEFINGLWDKETRYFDVDSLDGVYNALGKSLKNDMFLWDENTIERATTYIGLRDESTLLFSNEETMHVFRLPVCNAHRVCKDEIEIELDAYLKSEGYTKSSFPYPWGVRYVVTEHILDLYTDYYVDVYKDGFVEEWHKECGKGTMSVTDFSYNTYEDFLLDNPAEIRGNVLV